MAPKVFFAASLSEITMSNEPCETWSVALERERLGLLAADERVALDEHLAGCARCRAERRVIAATAEALAPPGDVLPQRDWDDLRARLDRARRAHRRELAIGVPAGVAAAAALLLARGWVKGVVFDAFGVGIVVGMTLAVVIAVVASWIVTRRLAHATPGSDLIRSIRRYYQRRISSVTMFAVLAPVYMGLLVMRSHFWGSGRASIVVRVVLMVLIVAAALNGLLRKRPRLVRELRDLENQ